MRQFFKRHLFGAAFLGVSIPLLVILGLQYRSFSRLRETLPIVQKQVMTNYLKRVNSRIEAYYRARAAECLHVSPEGFIRGYSTMTGVFDDHKCVLARRVFIATSASSNTRSYAIVLFYDPAERRFAREPGSRAWGAAHAASAQWLVYRLTEMKAPGSPLTVDERDPQNRVIVYPVVRDSEVFGVTGMVLDEDYFKDQVLGAIAVDELSKFFPENHRDMIVSARNSRENVVFRNRSVSGSFQEISMPLEFLFTDWRLSIGIANSAAGYPMSRWLSANLLLSIAMTLVLVGGILLTIRTASRAVKLSQMKSDFVSNVSHELRTPLASIRVFGEFLRLGRVTDQHKIREYGEYIETESRRLTQLINNILDFSRIESGRRTYFFERASPEDLIRQTIEALKIHLKQRNVRIIFEPPSPKLPEISMDAEAMTQALINLLDNAIKYGGSSTEIRVDARRDNGFIALSVTDHGIGIPYDDQERIFEKFYRVSTGLVHDVKGSGLGLSIVDHIVKAHKGKLSIASKPGVGSTFTIHLPIDAEPQEE